MLEHNHLSLFGREGSDSGSKQLGPLPIGSSFAWTGLIGGQPGIESIGTGVQIRFQRPLGTDIPLRLAECPQFVGQSSGQNLAEPRSHLTRSMTAELVTGRVRSKQSLLSDITGVELGREPWSCRQLKTGKGA